jgi:hypothetical protein
MDYLRYDAIVKKRCPECRGHEDAKRHLNKLFGKSYPENGGILMNKVKNMKHMVNAGYKLNHRDLALLYFLNDGFKESPTPMITNTNDEYDYESYAYDTASTTSTATPHLKDFDFEKEVKDLFLRYSNRPDSDTVQQIQALMSDLGLEPTDTQGTSSNALRTFKSRNKTALINALKPDLERYQQVRDRIEEEYLMNFQPVEDPFVELADWASTEYGRDISPGELKQIVEELNLSDPTLKPPYESPRFEEMMSTYQPPPAYGTLQDI